nr:TlpA disulfide reductase family protein [Sphingobacterium multivorum]
MAIKPFAPKFPAISGPSTLADSTMIGVSLILGVLRIILINWSPEIIGIQRSSSKRSGLWEINCFVRWVLFISHITAEFQKIIGSTPLPEDLSIVDMDKKPLLKAELAGKIVVIDFWATWCKPCIASFPYLHQVYKKYADDPQVKFVVLNSGSGNSWDDAYKWAQANPEFDFPFYYNQDKKLSSKLEITSIPTTLILDKKGNIRFRKVGFEGEKLLQSLDAMIEYLKELDQ